jgi:RHS repeat-associated protein
MDRILDVRLVLKTTCPRRGRGLSRGSFRNPCRSRFRSHLHYPQNIHIRRRTCFEGPFGELLRATGPMARANPFRFSTKYQDDESDLLYYGYRYYNASTGRWLSRDPIDESGGLNLYGFVKNACTQYYDLLGRNLGNPLGCGYGCIPPPDNPPEPFTWPWQGCCNGTVYNRFTHCCCKGKIVSKTPIDTGIEKWQFISSQPNPPTASNPSGAPDMHWWLTWPGGSVDANLINSTGDSGGGVNGPQGGGYVSSPALAVKWNWPGTNTPVKLSPCKYDFDKLIACLSRKAAYYAAKGFYSVGNCQAFVDNILGECIDESRGCTVK